MIRPTLFFFCMSMLHVHLNVLNNSGAYRGSGCQKEKKEKERYAEKKGDKKEQK